MDLLTCHSSFMLSHQQRNPLQSGQPLPRRPLFCLHFFLPRPSLRPCHPLRRSRGRLALLFPHQQGMHGACARPSQWQDICIRMYRCREREKRERGAACLVVHSVPWGNLAATDRCKSDHEGTSKEHSKSRARQIRWLGLRNEDLRLLVISPRGGN